MGPSVYLPKCVLTCYKFFNIFQGNENTKNNSHLNILQWHLGIVPPIEAVEEQEWSKACQLGFVLFPSILEVLFNTLTISITLFFSYLLFVFLVKNDLSLKSIGEGGIFECSIFSLDNRLTPIYMLVLGTHTALFQYWGSGPIWPSYTGMEPNCKDYWWRNLLYINNLFSNSEMVNISAVHIL